MATITMTKDNFEEIVNSDKTVLIDFWAEWCGPCKMFGPVFEAASEAHPDIVFAKVDTEAQRELGGYFQIQSIPTLMIFRERIMLFRQAGALPQSALEDLIGQVKALDMDEVRKKVAEQQQEQASANA